MKWAIPLLIVAIGLPGCAMVLKGSDQAIAIRTYPVDGAACTLSAHDKKWLVTSPGLAIVPKTMDDLTIHCETASYQGTAVIPSEFEEWTLANLMWPLPGKIIGFSVDGGLGTMGKYPDSFQVSMKRIAAPGSCYVGDHPVPMAAEECKAFGGQVM